MKTNNKTLIHALRILARDIQSKDGIANACIAEGADRIEELSNLWVSVDDEMPEEGIIVDIFCKSTENPDYGVRKTSIVFMNGGFNASLWGRGVEYVSHWMPIPGVPE